MKIIWERDIYDEIQGYHNDVLIIHGDRDSLVPISYSEQAVVIYNSARLVVLEGVGHGFYGQSAEKTIAEMIGYIRQQMI